MFQAPKGSAYTLPVTSKKLNSPPQLPTVPFYVQPQQPPQQLAQSKKLLYTQAYIAPLQPRYQLIYTQPSVIYSDPTAAYASDFYARVPTYIQDNSLRGQVNQYQVQQQQQQQLYVTPTTIAHEAPKEILQEHVSIQDLPQNYVKVRTIRTLARQSESASPYNRRFVCNARDLRATMYYSR